MNDSRSTTMTSGNRWLSITTIREVHDYPCQQYAKSVTHRVGDCPVRVNNAALQRVFLKKIQKDTPCNKDIHRFGNVMYVFTVCFRIAIMVDYFGCMGTIHFREREYRWMAALGGGRGGGRREGLTVLSLLDAPCNGIYAQGADPPPTFLYM